MQLSLYNHSVFPVNILDVRSKIRKVLLFLQRRYQIKVGRITVCLFRPLRMKEFMRRFEPNKTEVSDVLSFVEDESSHVICGDIAICMDRVKKDATQDKVDFEEYLQEIILHGILHLFGLKHGYSEQELEQVRNLHRTILQAAYII